MRIATLTLAVLLTTCAAACSRVPSDPATPVAVVEAPAPPRAAATAATPGTAPAVLAYLDTLAAVEKSTAPVSLEPLFDQAEAAQDALMQVTADESVLERYSEADFASLQATVRGLKLHREMDIYAQPEPAFFLALAKAHGRPADLAFFEQYAATWGPDLVPVYLKLRPQPTPCVRFGEGRIAPLYAGWKAFAAAHPGSYTARVAQNLGDLEEAVTLGTCACDGVESVRSEQAGFVKQFPDTPRAAAITARRDELATDPDKLPVNCR